MHTLATAVTLIGALMWPAAASAQSLAEAAQREAARRKTAANAPKTPPASPSAAPLAQQSDVKVDEQPSTQGTISLAEVARREAARRKALAASGRHGRSLTTGDVKKWEPPPQDTDPADSATTPDMPKDGSAKRADKAGATDTPNDASSERKGEEYWRNRMGSAREELRRNEAFAEALQSRVNALSADFAAKDDPYQRAQIADDRQKALAELDRLANDIDKNRKAIADIEDDARRAGVPAGWIR
jgi:hypothetical protein